MKISEILINNIRNHRQTQFEACGGLNIFHGLNGAGKTSILEAISVASFSKTFLPVKDKTIINSAGDFYLVSLKAQNDYDIPYKVKVSYQKGSRKKISSTIGEHLSPKDIIGEIPLVILSPDYKSITFGAPADRRQFIDRLLSQASKRYFEEMMKLKRTLKQRNSLLNALKIGELYDRSMLEPWNNLLIETGAEIIKRRNKFINDFVPYFKDIYKQVSNSREDVDIIYEPDSIPAEIISRNPEKEEIESVLREALKKNTEMERRRGTSSIGPQKDELKITINSGTAKDYASQGQHKTLLISLKFAEFNFLKNKRNETPVVLLDDIFSELDRNRAAKVLELIAGNAAQTFITLTEPDSIRQLLPDNISSSFFRLDNGELRSEQL